MGTDSEADAHEADRNGIVAETTETVTRSWHADGSFVVPLVEAVEEVTGQPTAQLAPLHSAIDPDAVESLLANQLGEVRVSFSYEGCHVTVWNTGTLLVRRA